MPRRLCSGLTACHWFEELRSKEAADTAILYPFDLIEHDGEDMRNHPFFDRKAALPRLLRNSAAGILFNEHIAEGGPCIVFARLGAEGIASKKVNSSYRSGRCPVWIRVRYPVAVQRQRSENWIKSSSAHSVHHAHTHTAILESVRPMTFRACAAPRRLSGKLTCQLGRLLIEARIMLPSKGASNRQAVDRRGPDATSGTKASVYR
jgi:hypothetical protein